MAKVQKVYTREFKEEAVRLAQTTGKPITQVARELGISDTSIHQWREAGISANDEPQQAPVRLSGLNLRGVVVSGDALFAHPNRSRADCAGTRGLSLGRQSQSRRAL
jgi:Zn-dependent membrane protease YugP